MKSANSTLAAHPDGHPAYTENSTTSVDANAADEEEADRLLNNAKPAVLELVSTLAAWRAREAIELPEFERVKDDWALERLIQNPETLRNLGQGETLGEALAEQFQRFKESFDPTLTEERMEREGRELEIGDED